MSQYITFHKLSDTGKTEVWSVNSQNHGNRLGLIKWYGPWRQYAFWPDAETVWNPACLDDATVFIRGLMSKRAEAKSA